MATSSFPLVDAGSSLVAHADVPVSFADVGADEPLVYVNAAFERLTGHAVADCIGRNCRFLQGPSTDPAAVARIRAGIDAGTYRLTTLQNYRADGVEFTNGLLVGPVRGTDGEALALVGMQWDVGEVLARRQALATEKAHWETHGPSVRLDRFERLVHLALDASREHDPQGDPTAFVERLVALAHPHQYPPHDRLPNWTWVSSLLPFLARPYGFGSLAGLHVDDRSSVVAVDVAYALSLAVHALARVTRERAVPDATPDVSCRLTDHRGEPVLELRWRVSTPSNPTPEPEAARGRTELDVVAHLFGRLGGALEFEFDRARFAATLRLPNRPLDALDHEA